MNLRNKVEGILGPIAEKYETKPAYWIDGANEGLSYCYECGKKVVQRLLKEDPNGEYFVSGGWGVEADGPESCEECRCALECIYTNYGVESELNHFEENGFDINNPSDCYSFLNMLDWLGLKGDENGTRVQTLANQIIHQSIEVLDGAKI